MGSILEAKLGPSWRQVGSYKGSKLHAKVTSMLSCFFIENYEFGSPQGDGGGLGEALLATWVFAFLVSKMQYIHWFSKVLQNRAGVPAGKKSPKGLSLIHI